MSHNKKHVRTPTKHPTNPATGESAVVKDVRQRFAELTARQPRDAEAERAFILAKIETVKKDRRLTQSEKRTAVRELETLLPQ